MQSIDKVRDHLTSQLGRVIAEARIRHPYAGAAGLLSQERLGRELGLSRSQIAHIEEGTTTIDSAIVRRICDFLEIPSRQWEYIVQEWSIEAHYFEHLTSELTGKHLSLAILEGVDACLAIERIHSLFNSRLSNSQQYDEFNSVLVFFGEKPISNVFFQHFLNTPAFQNLDAYQNCVREFQKVGMRLYGNFRKAWFELSRTSNLQEKLQPLEPADLLPYERRKPADEIEVIEQEHLRELGYIAARQIKQERETKG